MATQGKVLTLFEDKEKTKGIFPRTKVSAISDDNNIGLDVLLNNIDAKCPTRTLLWENPSPSSNIADDTKINLSSDDYDELEVYYKTQASGSSMMHTRTLKGFSVVMITGCYPSDQSLKFVHRTLDYVSDTQYNVNKCQYLDMDSSGDDILDNCVPYAIYGIKY